MSRLHATPFRELRLVGLRREFGGVAALRDVSLTVQRGEFIALLGPSGCGKTTALNLVAGLLVPTGGEIRLDERRIDRLAPEARGFGMVFQSYALFPHMMVRRNIGFGLRMRGVGREEAGRRVEEALALVRLQAHGDKLPGQLSGGQQQRVAIARAVVVQPPLVLMDEPLSNLDAKLRLEMRAEIRRIHQGLDATTLYVTHDQDEALSLADRIVVLRDGEVRQVGTPTELFERPASLDVASFMGFRNEVPGRVVQGGMHVTLDVEGALLGGVSETPLAPGAQAVLAVRPDDLTPGEGGIAVRVESSEYRGREWVGLARSAGGLELIFRAEAPVREGDALQLRPDPDRARVFPVA